MRPTVQCHMILDYTNIVAHAQILKIAACQISSVPLAIYVVHRKWQERKDKREGIKIWYSGVVDYLSLSLPLSLSHPEDSTPTQAPKYANLD